MTLTMRDCRTGLRGTSQEPLGLATSSSGRPGGAGRRASMTHAMLKVAATGAQPNLSHGEVEAKLARALSPVTTAATPSRTGRCLPRSALIAIAAPAAMRQAAIALCTRRDPSKVREPPPQAARPQGTPAAKQTWKAETQEKPMTASHDRPRFGG